MGGNDGRWVYRVGERGIVEEMGNLAEKSFGLVRVAWLLWADLCWVESHKHSWMR